MNKKLKIQPILNWKVGFLMKKIILIFLIILILIIIVQNKEYNLTEDTIRFRVIANSNSQNDLKMKELVVDQVSNILFYDESNDIQTEREQIIKNISNIENKIDDLFKSYKYNKNYNLSYGLNYFPKKEFMGKTFKEGEYESLVIEIGEAKGNNYFCILYPPLCMIDRNKGDIKYKSKILELLNEIF